MYKDYLILLGMSPFEFEKPLQAASLTVAMILRLETYQSGMDQLFVDLGDHFQHVTLSDIIHHVDVHFRCIEIVAAPS